tara:strand:+ start:161 stop:490 length:330 start_codon:yes stop_codon:yes gene_type:complete
MISIAMCWAHGSNSVLSDESDALMDHHNSCTSREIKMLKRFFRSMIIARQASAAMETLQYMSDRHLEDIGFTRETYIEQIKANIFAEFDAADIEKARAAPVNENLLGAV